MSPGSVRQKFAIIAKSCFLSEIRCINHNYRMTPTDSIQSSFLEQLRGKMGPNLSFVDELAELLNISRDSAYRRIRGETILSLDEVAVLTKHFGVSLDDFLMPSDERVSFQIKALNVIHISVEKWFAAIIGTLEMIKGFPAHEKELTYDAKDLPIFHFFQFPRLATFKIYFWMRTFGRDEKLGAKKYNPDVIDNKLISMSEKIWEMYANIPSVEIIGYEILTVTLRQIEYAYECGMFSDKQDAYNLFDDCSMLATHLQHQAELGSKQTYGSAKPGAKLDVYLNDVLIGANTFFCKLDSKRMTFLTPNVFNLMMTSHDHFCDITQDHIANMIEKSILISVKAEKERNKFFNRVEENIQRAKSRIV